MPTFDDLVDCVQEIQKESRKFTATYTKVEQDLVYVLRLKDDATTTFGDGDPHTLAIELGFLLLPRFRVTPSQENTPTILLLDKIAVEEIGTRLFKIIGSYAYDENHGFSGQSGGSEGVPGEDGPASEMLPQLRLNFTLGGDTRHITKSIQVLSEDARTNPDPGMEDPEDLDGGIGVSHAGIAGMDIIDDSLKIQITVYYYPQFVNFNLITKLKGLIAKINNDVFLNQPAGNVLLTGVSGGGTVLDIIPITFDFEIKDTPSLFDPGFPDLPTGIHGFHVIDYVYKRKFIPNKGDFILVQPDWRYVHQVYYLKDFSVLGFG